MLKLEIKLDETRIAQENRYSSAAIYEAIDKTFLKG